MSDSDTQWLVDLYEEHGTRLHRLVVLLGAESESGHILRSALVGLSRRAHRLVDPVDRVGFLAEEVVHDARSTRGPRDTLALPGVQDPRQQGILMAINALPIRLGEVLVVSHYLSVYGPELAGILRMTVRSANRKLEEALHQVRHDVGEAETAPATDPMDSMSEEVTGALRASARLVQPAGTDTLEAELKTLNATDRNGVALAVFIPLLVGALVLGFGLAAATTPDMVAEPAPTATATPKPTASSSRSLPSQVRAVPVYYVGRQDNKLYRELRDLAATEDLVRTAIEAILEVVPLDHDYTSLWGTGRLIDVEMTGHNLELNMSASVFDKLTTAEAAQAAVDQIVYTASELVGDPELRVTFLSEGAPPPELLRSEEGFGRRGLEPMPALWVSSPKNAAKITSGHAVVAGVVKPEAAAPLVRITDDDNDNKLVSSTFAQTSTETNAEGWRGWTVTVPLPPGNYTIEASTQIEGSDGRPRSVSEDKSITVS